jgi:hypothetical protein
VGHNLGFGLFRAIEQAKKRLSSEPVTKLDFAYGDVAIHELVTRGRFESMISQETRAVWSGVQQVLDDAGLVPSQIDAVLRTGGTSAVPAFTRILAAVFGESKLRSMEMLTSVVGGLAVVAHDGGGRATPYAETYTAPPSALVKDVRAGSDRLYELYNIRTGARCFTDRPCTLNRLPIVLSGLPAIRTATADSAAPQDEFLQLTIEHPCRVYVACDARAASAPDWLHSFALEDATLEISDWSAAMVYRLYSRAFPAGRVVLGGNQANGYRGDVALNYLVAVKPLLPDTGGTQQ